MSGDISEYLLDANNRYQELQNVVGSIAYAAHEHPGIAYDIESSRLLNPDYEENLNASRAETDIAILSPRISDTWTEAQEYLMFEVVPEVEMLEKDSVEVEAYNALEDKFKELEEELVQLDKAINHVADVSLVENSGEEFIFEGSTTLSAD